MSDSAFVLIGNEPSPQPPLLSWVLERRPLPQIYILPLYVFWSEQALTQTQTSLIESATNARLLGEVAEFSDPKTAALAILERANQINPGLALPKVPANELWARLIMPREGIISPWSTQATEIANRIGLQIARIEYAYLYLSQCAPPLSPSAIADEWFYDRMVEQCGLSLAPVDALLRTASLPRSDELVSATPDALEALNQRWGLSLSPSDIAHLSQIGLHAGRGLYASELMMYAQINSEHCRHKLFNARWRIADVDQTDSLFEMIVRTHTSSPKHTLEAYHDNAAILSGFETQRWLAAPGDHRWQRQLERTDFCIKVESHNHPTAILPFAGAATGSGGEIRDESATGRGGQPIGGFSGFMVSDLLIPGAHQSWETELGYPDHVQNAFSIMLGAPIGAARCNNEFGRPSLGGFFRTLTTEINSPSKPDHSSHDNQPQAQADKTASSSATERNCQRSFYGYHKPVMLAGGYGLMRWMHQRKLPLNDGSPIIVLGGPAMLLGLGGGSLSSQANKTQSGLHGEQKSQLDFASVQRSNPEVQRRCHEVLRHCIEEGEGNPIRSIHDIGAGGLANAVSEIVDQADKGARVSLSKVPCLDQTMTPMEIWCNESQERYVLVVDAAECERFEALCRRERCLYAIIGEVTPQRRIVVFDALDTPVVDMALSDLIEPQKRHIDIPATAKSRALLPAASPEPVKAIEPVTASSLDGIVADVLQLPAVASKRFLVTIGDRSVGGLTTRDQMVGPFQEPVADVAVSRFSIDSHQGIAMAIGERASIATINPVAASRVAFCESLTNLLAAGVSDLAHIRVSANWMVASGQASEDLDLFNAVQSVCADLAIPLGISIPVGKDSVNMRTVWTQNSTPQSLEVKSPLSLVVTAFAKVDDVASTLTPYLPEEQLVLLRLPMLRSARRLGGSALAYVRPELIALPSLTADVADASDCQRWFNAWSALRPHCLSYHDVSDGGLLTTIAEMALCARMGVQIDLAPDADVLAELFNEECAAVVAVRQEQMAEVQTILAHWQQDFQIVGHSCAGSDLTIKGAGLSWRKPLAQVWQWWHETSYQMQSRRDNPDCARSEHEQGVASFAHRRGLYTRADFVVNTPAFSVSRPKVAILREQGCNGHSEMAYAFDRAGFDARDVCMQDLLDQRFALSDFQVLAACGGFSYADVLGAGRGWALGVLHSQRLRDAFEDFFRRDDTLSLGVCNGCQFLSHLRELIPGTDDWPVFETNLSQQYESRLVMVSVQTSASVWFEGMHGSHLPIVVAHGEGRASQACAQSRRALCYIDPHGQTTSVYPHNPNGSSDAIAAVCSTDGRSLIMMPHPERLIDPEQFSWLAPENRQQPSPWLQMFYNARKFI